MSRYTNVAGPVIAAGVLFCLVALAPFPCLAGREQPKIPGGIGGIMLGDKIDKHREGMLQQTGFVDPEEPYLTHYELNPPPGYKAVTVSTGNCLNKGKILRIKMKYAREDNDFFKMLKNSIEKLYNATPTYGGDPFHIYELWKWRFETDSGTVVILSLQRYMGNDEEHPHGNVIKLSLFSEIVKERLCYQKQHKAERPPESHSAHYKIEYFIPVPLNINPGIK